MNPKLIYIAMNSENLKKYEKLIEPRSKLLVLDIDDTVYPNTYNIEAQLKYRTMEYIKNRYNIHDIEGVFMNYREKYGTGTKGFIIDKPDFSHKDYVENILSKIDYDILEPDKDLKTILNEFKGYLIAFTNAPKEHAENVLKKLEIEDCFDYIFHVDMTDKYYICKPEARSYYFIEKLFNTKPENIFFVDDRMVNIAKAQERKWNAVMVSSTCDIKSILKSIKENTIWSNSTDDK
ncbi:hypothetical protein DMUE_1357 [Dictyocoela muelleri]|nr:hypothetical protein DMUE_1357 [Dictyocoela muelleri]